MTSGVITWAQTRDNIITGALKKLGQLSEGDTATTTQISEMAEALEMITKDLQNGNMFLWTREWVQKTFSASSEVTGSDGNIYTCILGETATVVTKPITGANYTTHWKLGGSTGGAWVLGTTYNAIGDFTPETDTKDIVQAFIRKTDGRDVILEILPFSDYFDIPNKGDDGTPNSLFLDKQLTPKVYLHKQPDSTDYVLHYLKIRILEDFNASTMNPDAPTNWIRAFVWMLADEKSMDYAIPVGDRQEIERKAEKYKTIAMKSNIEITSGEFVKGAF